MTIPKLRERRDCEHWDIKALIASAFGRNGKIRKEVVQEGRIPSP